MNFLKMLFGGPGNNLPAEEAKTRLGEFFILDVRQPDEFHQGHIAGSKLIPLNELPKRLNELPKDREILCVCRSGARSGSAVRHLTNVGYQAINLQRGMIGWQMAGYPVKKGK